MLYFVLHTRLLQARKSEQTVHAMMVNQFTSLLNEFDCLCPINETITQEVNSCVFLCY